MQHSSCIVSCDNVGSRHDRPELFFLIQEHGVIKYLAGHQFSCSGTIRKARELAVQQVAFNHRPFSTLRRT